MIARAAVTVLVALLGTPAALGSDAWPMRGHDVAGSSRSSVVSAQRPALLPGWPVGGSSARRAWRPVEPSSWPRRPGRTAILNRDGTVRRILRAGPVAAIGRDGRRYVIDPVGDSASAVTSAGDLLWRTPRLTIGPEASDREVRPAPDGNVYVTGDRAMVALDSSERIRWRVGWDAGGGTLAVDPDGTVYLGFLQGSTAMLVARRPDGQTTWSRPLDARANRIAVADDGAVVVLRGPMGPQSGMELPAFAPDGGVRRSLPVGRDANGPAIGADGSVYLVVARGILRADGLLVPGELRAIGPDGNVRWAYRGRIASDDPVVGGDGTVCLGGSPLLALHPDGTRAWTFPPASRPIVPEAIGADGTLLAEGGGGAMFALAGPSARARVTPPSPAHQRTLIAGLRLRPARFRMRGPASICPSPGRGCRPRTPLGATVSFTLTRDSLVSVAVRRAGRRAVVARREWRAGAGTTWSALRDAIGHRNLTPGRYTLTVRAARGATRVTAKPLGFTIAL